MAFYGIEGIRGRMRDSGGRTRPGVPEAAQDGDGAARQVAAGRFPDGIYLHNVDIGNRAGTGTRGPAQLESVAEREAARARVLGGTEGERAA